MTDEEFAYFLEHGRLPGSDPQSSGDPEFAAFMEDHQPPEPDPVEPEAPGIGQRFRNFVGDAVEGTATAAKRGARDFLRWVDPGQSLQGDEEPRREAPIFQPGAFDAVLDSPLAPNEAIQRDPTPRDDSALVTTGAEGIKERETLLETLANAAAPGKTDVVGPNQGIAPEETTNVPEDPEFEAFMQRAVPDEQQAEFDRASHIERRRAMAEGRLSEDFIPTPDAVQGSEIASQQAAADYEDDLFPRQLARAAVQGVRDAPGIIGSLARMVGPEELPMERLVREGYVQMGATEQGFKILGTFAPAVVEVLLTKKIATNLAGKLPGKAGQIADLVGRSAAGSRAGGAATGALEGLPTDLATAAESGDFTDAGLGIAIGAVTGFLMPGKGRLADEVVEAINKSPQQMTEALVDWVNIAQQQGDDAIRRSLETVMARSYREGNDVIVRVLDDVLDRTEIMRTVGGDAARTLDEVTGAGPRIEVETVARPRSPEVVRERELQMGDLPTQGEVAARNAQADAPEFDPDAFIREAGDDGVSFDPSTNRPVDTSGMFVVSPDKATEQTVKDLTPETLRGFKEKWSDLLSEEGNFMGAYRDPDTGHWDIDVSRGYPTEEAAQRAAMQADQKYIFNGNTGDLIPTRNLVDPRKAPVARYTPATPAAGRNTAPIKPNDDATRATPVRDAPAAPDPRPAEGPVPTRDVSEPRVDEAPAPRPPSEAAADVDVPTPRSAPEPTPKKDPVQPKELDEPTVRERFDEVARSAPEPKSATQVKHSFLDDLNEAGFIHPALQRALGAAAIGGVGGAALGAASSLDDEDRTGRAALGAAVGIVVGLGPSGWRILDEMDNSVGRTFRKYMTAGGTVVAATKEVNRELVEGVRRALRTQAGLSGEFDKLAQQNIADLAAAVGKEYGGTGRARAIVGGDNPFDAMPVDAREMAARLIRDTDDDAARAALPDDIAKIVDRMRYHIDDNSTRLKKLGAVEGDMKATFDANLGTYLNRSYRIFDDPDWAKEAPKALGDAEWARVKNQFKSYFRSTHDPSLTDDELEVIMKEYLAVGEHANPLSFIKANASSLNKSILKQRQSIPLPVRELWGEYDDPMLQYTRTISQQGQYIANYRFLREMADVDDGSLFWRPRDASGNPVPIDEAGQKKVNVRTANIVDSDGMTATLPRSMGPLAGMKTYPEMAEALTGQFDGISKVEFWPAKAALWTLSMAKVSKTVLSQVTQVRNLTGNPLFLLAQGHLNPATGLTAFGSSLRTLMKSSGLVGEEVGRGGRALNAAAEGLGLARKDEDLGRFFANKLVALNVLDDTANAKELEMALKRVIDVPINDWGAKSPLAQQARRLVQTGKTIPFATYRAGDDLFKATSFLLERRRFAKALEGVDDISDDLLDEMAAKAAVNLNPTYSQTPEIINKLRRVGGFLSFPSEVLRVQHSTMKQIAEEWNFKAPDGSHPLRKIAAQRVAGTITAATAMTTGMALASRKLFNITKEEEDAVREFTYPWDENANLVFLSEIGKDGNFEVWNSTYTAPHSQLIRPMVAFMRGEDWETTMKQTAWEAIAPFAQLNPALTELQETIEEGAGHEWMEKAIIAAEGMYRTVAPGAIDQWTRAITGQSSSRRSVDRQKEMFALFTGQKSFSSKIEEDLLWDFRTTAGRLLEVSEEFEDADEAGYVDRYGVIPVGALREFTVGRRRDVIQDVARKINAAVVLGKSTREIRNIMDESEMPHELRDIVWAEVHKMKRSR